MWWLVIILVLFAWWWVTRKEERMSDEQHIQTVLGEITSKRPELYPIETLYIEPDGRSRFMMLNTDTYAGELYDYFPSKK